jgi:6,7-dimethyl-8-ribityllumazine synthase
MAKTIEGHLRGDGLRVAIVASRFNALVVDRLIEGALDGLRKTGVDDAAVTVVRTPGAFELPYAAKVCAASGAYDAVICLGAVIRGGTPHFDYVAGAAASGIANVAQGAEIPVIFGVLTCDTVEQALDRAGVKAGNKGWDAALTAVEMVDLGRRLPEPRGVAAQGTSEAPSPAPPAPGRRTKGPRR